MQCVLNPHSFIILQVENNLGFRIIDNSLAKTPLIQIEKVIEILAGTNCTTAIATNCFKNLKNKIPCKPCAGGAGTG